MYFASYFIRHLTTPLDRTINHVAALQARIACDYYLFMLVLFTCSDVAMLLRDPYALDVLCKTILQCLLQIYEQNKLPRVSF